MPGEGEFLMYLYLIQKGDDNGHSDIVGLLSDKDIALARVQKYQLPSTFWWISIESFKEVNGEFVHTAKHDDGHLDYYRDDEEERTCESA